MPPPESEPVPLQARRFAVPLLEASPVRRLPLLCMCLSFEFSILFETFCISATKIVLVPVAVSGHFEIIATSAVSKLEQNLAAAIRFQGLFERFLELVKRVHMFYCGGERSIRHEVSQRLVNLFDLCAGCVA